MKTRITLLQIIILFAFTLTTQGIIAQDTIFKNNGTVIYAQIIEVGTNAISFKKTDFPGGPTFLENKVDISAISYRNGQHQEFVKVETPKISSNTETSSDNNNSNSNNNSNTSTNNNTNANNNKNNTNTNNRNNSNDPLKNDPLKNGPVNTNASSNSTASSSKIEVVDGKYFKNGQKLGRKSLDKELSKSTNPLVQVSLKTAKLAKISQKIVGITSIPSTIAGGVASIATISQAITAYQTGAITPQYYVNAGLSFLGTLTVPITSKILKKQRDKLYNKTIDLYNLGN